MALVHACPGCGRLVPYGTPRCPECEAKRRAYLEARSAERKRAYEARRRAKADPRYRAFYRSREWRALSVAALQRAGWRCEDCGGVACEAHHDPPIQTPEGWERRLDPSCVHALCTRCHNARHGRFRDGDPGGGRKSSGGPRGERTQGPCSAQKTGDTN